jgi:hypothetical protein
MSVFSDAIEAILHDPGMRIAGSWRSVTIYGDYSDTSMDNNGLMTKDPSYEVLTSDIEGAANGDAITVNGSLYYITRMEPGQHGSTLLILARA